MKGEISIWYLVLIAIAVVSMLTVLYIADTMIEETFISAMETAFN